MEVLQRQRIPAGAVLDAAGLSADPHLAERAYFVENVAGSQKPFMGFPFQLSASSPFIRWRGPDLGEHNEYLVCRKLGRPGSDVPQLREEEIGFAYDPE
jgi:crotonobetainyl-CoA:carnitine CoA-transferase CaiB-like acyl-CoA transferase